MVVRQRLLDQNAGAKIPLLPAGNDLRRVRRLQAPTSTVFPVSATRGDVFEFGVVAGQSAAPVRLAVYAGTGAKRRALLQTQLENVAWWTDNTVNLAAGDTEVTLEFSGGTAEVAVAEPRVLGGGPAMPNVLVYVVDCLRSDRVGAYGNKRGITPSIDRLAAQGHVFERAFACAGWTKPSVGCLFTGVDAPRHGARSVASALDPQRPTLASLLGAAGYDTAAFVANPVLDGKAFGYSRGFDRYVELASEWHGKAVNNVEGDAAAITAAVIPWIDAHRSRPFFLYLHSLDLHYPYRARAPHEALVRAGSQGLARDSDLYDSEIAANDVEIGKLLDALAERGLDRSTHVLLTADHGEEFGEHDTARHGHSLYEQILQIPMILRTASGGTASRISADVSNVDIVPTILELAGVGAPRDLTGVSLKGLVEKRPMPPRTLFHEQIPANEIIYAARAGRYKRIRELLPKRREMLFDLVADPGERVNLAANPPPGTDGLRADLDYFVQSAQAGHHIVLADAPEGREMHAEITSTGRIAEMLSLQFATGDIPRPSAGGAAVLRYVHAGERRVLLVRTEPEDAPIKVRLLENRKELPAGAVVFGTPPAKGGEARVRAWVFRVGTPRGPEALSPENLARMKALGYIN